MRRRQQVVERSLRKVELYLIQRLKRVAKVHENQIALVSDLRKQPRLRAVAGPLLQLLECGRKFGNALRAFTLRAGAPRLPVKPEKLMQQSGPFKRKRDGRKLSQRNTSFVR